MSKLSALLPRKNPQYHRLGAAFFVAK